MEASNGNILIPQVLSAVPPIPLKPGRRIIDPKTKDRLLRFFIIKFRQVEWTLAIKNVYIKALNRNDRFFQ